MNYLKLIYDRYSKIVSYLFFGGITTLINILTFTMLNQFNGLNYQVANVIAWLLSVIFAYCSNKLWVFHSKTKGSLALIKEISSFSFYRCLSLLLDIGIMWVGISLLNGNPILVKIVDNVLIVTANYVFSKLFIFKSISRPVIK